MPQYVEFEISRDGQDWEPFGKVDNDISPRLEGSFIKLFEAEGWGTARFIRFRAKSIGNCPDWHKGAGLPSWLFADELIIE